jgi:hypothetical protein
MANYVLFPGGASGHRASTPDTASNSITGDFGIILGLSFDDVPPDDKNKVLAAKFVSGSQAWILYINGTDGVLDGQPQAYIENAAGSFIEPLSSATLSSVGITAGQIFGLGMTVDVDNGAAGTTSKFWYSTDYNTTSKSGTWVSLAIDVDALISNIRNSTDPVWWGEFNATDAATDTFKGKLYVGQLYSGIGADTAPGQGTLVNELWAQDAPNAATSWVSSATGETYTLTGATLVGDAVATGPMYYPQKVFYPV